MPNIKFNKKQSENMEDMFDRTLQKYIHLQPKTMNDYTLCGHATDEYSFSKTENKVNCPKCLEIIKDISEQEVQELKSRLKLQTDTNFSLINKIEKLQKENEDLLNNCANQNTEIEKLKTEMKGIYWKQKLLETKIRFFNCRE